MHTSVCMEWGEKPYPSLVLEKSSEDIFFLINYKTRTKDNFKRFVNSLNGLVWYATDLRQTVDAG